jgi:hypothetical protein
MAPDRPGYDTLGDPDSSQPIARQRSPEVALIKSMLKKDRALVELRDLQCTNETIQRSYVVPGSILKRLRI